MYINKELFNGCYCSTSGIGRVCLKSDRDIPNELVRIAKRIDGENYSPFAFGIDVFNGGATINYSAIDEFVDFGYACDNYEEVLSYYMENADKVNLKETFKDWY